MYVHIYIYIYMFIYRNTHTHMQESLQPVELKVVAECPEDELALVYSPVAYTYMHTYMHTGNTPACRAQKGG